MTKRKSAEWLKGVRLGRVFAYLEFIDDLNHVFQADCRCGNISTNDLLTYLLEKMTKYQDHIIPQTGSKP